MTKYESKLTFPPFALELDDFTAVGEVDLTWRFEAEDLWDAAQIVQEAVQSYSDHTQHEVSVSKPVVLDEVEVMQSQTVPEAMARVRQRLIDKGLRPSAAATDLVGYQMLLDILDEVEGVKPEDRTGEDTWRPPGAPLGTEAALLAEREEQAFKAAKERGWILGTPAVGAGATLSVGSDRYPYTIREVETFKTGKRAGQVRAVLASLDDVVRREDGAEEQFTTRLDREPERFTVTSAVVGRGPVFKGGGGTLRLSGRTYYQAPEV